MFTKFFGKGRAKAKAEAKPTLSPGIVSSILALVGAKGVPSMPGAAQKAFQLSTDPNAEARDFIEVIESDEALSARIIKIANSVFFERGKSSTTIEESVLVIGIEELRSLLNATTLSEIFPSRSPIRAQLWANDIATALISKKLAQRLLPEKADLAFLGGLMHDVGKLLLLQRAPEMYAKVIQIVEREGCTFSEAETQVFVCNHTEAGQLIAERWSFSTELLEIIRNHHDPFTSEDYVATKPIRLSLIVKCADIIAHSLGLGHPKGFSRVKMRYEKDLQVAFDILRVSATKQKEVLADFQKTYESEYELYAGSAKH